ncbi:hypothetical protein [Burkholderia pseudomallei]|uniref:hypothetical protein n=1 Tax=Burkholderia pseudomallei TaxID=28450 RepID=UPI00052AE33C|nr:hypothetical protein [Burkholderia pseudomallei]AIV50011.1 hypothetical protein Y603_1908 [Burkholderia pseudomallei MSHR1153]KGS60206.1 hypothetical protein X949_232 [Burkholderia pseudomallei MSHR5609]
MKKTLSKFLLERPRAASALNDSNQIISKVNVHDVDAQIHVLIKNAQQCISSPLVRKAKAYPRFAIGASTFSKRVAAGELPQPAYRDNRITAYREIDMDMMLAAQTLATRNGFMLNARAFVAALNAPGNPKTE